VSKRAANNDIASSGAVMVQRKTMDHRSWGTHRSEDREYAKALRDHAGTGSTQPLVEVEYGVLLTGDLSISGSCQLAKDLADTLKVADNETLAAVYNFLKQRGDL
jgi:hypothetical protein